MSETSGDLNVAQRETVEFWKRLQGLLISRGDGKQQINLTALRELVRADPERSVAACQAYMKAAADRQSTWHAYAQLAAIIAKVYEAEFDDDSLLLWLDEEFKVARIEMRPIQWEPGRIQNEPPDRTCEVLEIDSGALKSGDIYPFVVNFSLHDIKRDAGKIERMRELRGRLLITFDVPSSDSREVWEIPEIRAYVSLLFAQLPYLPYFLNQDPKYSMLGMWILCLAPPEAETEGKVDLLHESVLLNSAWMVYSVGLLAEILGEDPMEVRTALLAPYPRVFTAIVDAIVNRIAEADDDG